MQHIPLHHMYRARCNMHQATRNMQHHSRHHVRRRTEGWLRCPSIVRTNSPSDEPDEAPHPSVCGSATNLCRSATTRTQVRYNAHAAQPDRSARCSARARRSVGPVRVCAGRTRVGAVPVQMWQGWAQSRRRCGQPAASAVPVQRCGTDRDTASKVVEPSAEAFLSAFSSCATLAAICARIE